MILNLTVHVNSQGGYSNAVLFFFPEMGPPSSAWPQTHSNPLASAS